MDENGAETVADAVDWAAVREVYEAGEVPVRDILADHRITHWQLKRRYRAEGWTVRPQVAQPGRPALMRRPVEAAMILIARLIEAGVERLLATPEGAAAPPPLPEGELRKITELAKALAGLVQADTLSRQQVRRAAAAKSSARRAVAGGRSRISATSALDGGRNKEEEARAADEAFMRAELKRRTDILAAAVERGEISLDRRDEGGVAPAEA